MKKLNLLFALIFICGFSVLSSAISVQITSPVSGSTVSSPVTINAKASPGPKTTGWWVYVDGVGVYSAGATPSISPSISMSSGTHQVTVRAWNGSGAYASANVSLTVPSSTPPPSSVSVSISPTSAALQTGASAQFTASVSGTTNTSVTWLVNGTQGGNSTVGTISSTGLYTAPATAPSGSSATITAKSVADATKSANATVSISATPTPVSVTISPTAATVQGGQSKQFTASVTGTTNSGINWQVGGVTGGNSTVGLISSTGMYTAPASVPATNPVTVTARSAYDSTASANSAVTITASTSSTGKDLYVSTSGSDSNDGSAAHPWQTIQKASSIVTAGYTVHVAPGTYNVSSCSYPTSVCYSIRTTASGTASARIRFVSDVKWGAKIVSGNNTYYAWEVEGNYVDIEGFDITGSAMVGIRLNGSYQRAMNNLVHNLGFLACDGNGGAGIVSANYTASGNNDAIGNIVHDIGTPGACNTVQGIYYANYGGHIQNNIVYRVARWGITAWHAANNLQISNNTVFANAGGIGLGAGDSPGGVTFDNSIVANNIIYNNSGRSILETGSTGTHNQYLNNLTYGNASDILLQNGNTASGTIYADPQFVNYQANGTGDYHLKSTSPAINKGNSIGAPNTDFDGGFRPINTYYDIGAYEYGSTPATWPWQ